MPLFTEDGEKECGYPIGKGKTCGDAATYALYIGGDGRLELYLCKAHRPSFEKLTED